MEQESVKFWYRYVDVSYAPLLDEYDMPMGDGVLKIECRQFRVLKHTPKGVWLSDTACLGYKRFVLNKSKKRFACATKEEAIDSFVARKKRQHSVYMHRAKRAEAALYLATGIRKELNLESYLDRIKASVAQRQSN
jgi:hypothetical protein